MKKRVFLIGLSLLFLVETAALLTAALQKADDLQDPVAVNEVLQSVQGAWGHIREGQDTKAGAGRSAETGEKTGGGVPAGDDLPREGAGRAPEPDYVVLDLSGKVLYRTRPGLSESINEAVRHRDTILDVEVEGARVGKLIVYNGSGIAFGEKRAKTIALLAFVLVFQGIVLTGYFFYLEWTVVKPFRKLKGFAERVAGGNLEVPLEMDRKNRFGAFTEAFDLMRSELKKARIAEAKANAEKKELVAKLSHDIKTPVASIKAAAEVGAAMVAHGGSASGKEWLQENYEQIVRKADQIDTLVTGLFTATLEELRQLPVHPADMESPGLSVILKNADYLHRAALPEIPDCLLWADGLRLQQVFDNLFANSYKYAGTDIEVEAGLESRFLVVSITDFGGGVAEEELPFLKEKFKRGKNAEGLSGAGLGLFISDYFMKEMGGELVLENGDTGLLAFVKIRLSGAP